MFLLQPIALSTGVGSGSVAPFIGCLTTFHYIYALCTFISINFCQVVDLKSTLNTLLPQLGNYQNPLQFAVALIFILLWLLTNMNYGCDIFLFSSIAKTLFFLIQTDSSSEHWRYPNACFVWRVFCNLRAFGQHYLGDGFPPTVSRELFKNSALSVADGRAATSSLSTLHRYHGRSIFETGNINSLLQNLRKIRIYSRKSQTVET